MSCGKATTQRSNSSVITPQFLEHKYQTIGLFMANDLTNMKGSLRVIRNQIADFRKRLEKLEQNPTANRLQLPSCPEEPQLKTARPDRSTRGLPQSDRRTAWF